MLIKAFPHGKVKALTLSYDDGVEQDLRLMEILRKYGVACTFNLNGGMMEGDTWNCNGTVIRRLLEETVRGSYGGFEIALHGYKHIQLAKATRDEAIRDVALDRFALESIAKCPVRGMAYANGSYSASVIELLRQLNVIYARTTHSTHEFRLPDEFLAWHPTCHHNDERLFELADKFLGETRPGQNPVFYLWGHSYEFDLRDNWQRIEDFCARVSGKDDIWYATNGEIYAYAKAMEALVSSCDGDYVYNPSGVAVWVRKGEQVVAIQPGETKEVRE